MSEFGDPKIDIKSFTTMDKLIKLEGHWKDRLDRIERMLKFLCIRARVMDFKDLDDASAMPLHGKALTRLKKLLEASPDISDILEEK